MASTLLLLFAIVVFINCLYLLLFTFFGFSKSSPAVVKKNLPVAVIICAKNEAENLKNNIPFWLAQDYSNFELILVNDASYDNTLEIIEHFAAQDSRIKIVNVINNEAFWANKKYALTLGIKKAKSNYLIFTDADCVPADKQWIQTLINQFTIEKQLILGYGAYEKRPGLLNRLIRFETLMTAIQYFSFAKIGCPYMGVGRNMAYTSTLFYKTNGFMSHMNIRSGDDDLFVNEVATKSNTAICTDPKAFTISIPKTTWKTWIYQKRRHITTAQYYKFKHRLALFMFSFTSLLFWISISILPYFVPWQWLILPIAVRFLLHFTAIYSNAQKLKETGLQLLIPFLEITLLFNQMIIFISTIFTKPKHWK